MNTLLYRVIRIDKVTGERRHNGQTITVAGKRFSKKSDREALDQTPTCTTDLKTGHVISYEVERINETALQTLATTLREAAALLEEVERNALGVV